TASRAAEREAAPAPRRRRGVDGAGGRAGFSTGRSGSHRARRRVAAGAARDAALLVERALRAGSLPPRDAAAHPPADRGPALGPARGFRADRPGTRLRAACLSPAAW